MAKTQSNVENVYRTVMDDVVNGVRDSFLDEGLDEQVLQELRQLWEAKLDATKAVQPDIQDHLLQSHIHVRSQNQQKAGILRPGTTQQQQQVVLSEAPAMVPIQITVPAPQGGAAKVITVYVPKVALEAGAAHTQLQSVLSSSALSATLALPVETATSVLQHQINHALQSVIPNLQTHTVRIANRISGQVDGLGDTSDEDDDDDDDDVDDDDDDQEKDENEEDENNDNVGEALNSDDDVSDEDTSELQTVDNVVVCQFEKVSRARNKWKFQLKDGIMSLNGKDYVFHKANGEAEW